MNTLGVMACKAGFQDGFNPCVFMACAVLIVQGVWLKWKSLNIGLTRMLFVLVYAASTLIFDFGPFQIVLLQKNFIFAAKAIYFVLGLGALILGIIFFKDWLSLSRGFPADGLPTPRGSPPAGESRGQGRGNLGVLLATIVLAIALSSLATLWPGNNYILLLGNFAYLKGQWQMVMPLLMGYVLFSIWPLWSVGVFLSVKNLRPSLVKIVCAAIFFTASSGMILIFR